jgi:hypothetical protein
MYRRQKINAAIKKVIYTCMKLTILLYSKFLNYLGDTPRHKNTIFSFLGKKLRLAEADEEKVSSGHRRPKSSVLYLRIESISEVLVTTGRYIGP